MSKKETILEIAEDLFANNGYTSTSIDDIASKCEITKAAIYYHFKNKHELYAYILKNNFQTLAQEIEKAVDNENSIEKKLEAYIVTFAVELDKNRNIASLIMREMANGGADMPQDALKQMLRTFKVLSNIIKSGEEQKIFTCIEPMLIQMMILGSFSFLITTQNIREKVKKEIDPEAKTVINHSIKEAALKISHTLLNSLKE